MLHFIFAAPQIVCFDNNEISAFIPQRWANAGVKLTVENFVAAASVNQDFNEMFQDYGDVVNTRQPVTLMAYRKGVDDNVRKQSVRAVNIPIPLNQHIHTSFVIKDSERTKAFQELARIYVVPAAQALARKADKIVLSQYVHFLAYQAGVLGGLTSSNAVQYIAEGRGQLNRNNCPDDGSRQIIWGTDADTTLIQNETFVQAHKSSNGGETQRTGYLGNKFNFHNYMAQNVPQLIGDSTTGTGTMNAGNLGRGATVLTVTGFAASEVIPGNWITIGGRVYHVTATNNATATQLTLEWGLKVAVGTSDPIVVCDTANVTESYAAGWDQEIILDNGSGGQLATDIQIGQMISFGTSTIKYAVIDFTVGATVTRVELDRPLAADLDAATVANLGPTGGGFNMAFHRDCMTLAIRPLASVDPGLGAKCAVMNYGGISVRVTFTYDGDAQGTLCTMDMLCGIKVLDPRLAAVILT